MENERGVSGEKIVNSAPTNVPRVATLRDAPAILHLLDLMHDELAPRLALSAGQLALFEEIHRQEGRSLLVIEDGGGDVVGTADVLVVKNLSRNMSSWSTVENLVVHPQSRGHGLGRALVEKAIDIARQAHCYKIQLISNNARCEAHSLYRSLGFDADVSGFRRYLTDVLHA